MGQSPDQLAKSRAGAPSKTNQSRVCQMFPASDPRRILRCWRPSADGRRRTAHGVRVAWGSMAPALPSRCPFGRIGKGQSAKVVGSLGCLAASCKGCPFFGLQKLKPVGDVARVSVIAVKAKFGTQEC